MPAAFDRLVAEVKWTINVPLPPEQLAARMATSIDEGDPDSGTMKQFSDHSRKELVGKVNVTGFRVREHFEFFSGNLYRPVAWASFTTTSDGTRVECHIPGVRRWRWSVVYILIPFLLVFLAFALYQLSRSAEVGTVLLILCGFLALMLGLFQFYFSNGVGNVKESIGKAVWRSMNDPHRK